MARAHRAALTEGAAPDPDAVPAPATSTAGAGRAAVEAVWRTDAARIVATLARSTGDLALAEDVAQEALAEALVAWSRDGVPARPAGWLITAGRRRAVDAYRRRAALDERYAAIGRALDASGGLDGTAAGADGLADPDRVDDDVLALIFVACHPVLSREAQVALTLRVVGGLTSDEIARALLVPTATVQARVTRAKRTLGAARVSFAVPDGPERRERLGSVLAVLYLVFTEGSSATSGDDLIRHDLAREAVRLARVLARLQPDEPEVLGLLALLELTAARFPARTAPDGSAVLLEDQDRRRWDRAAIRRGRAALAAAGRVGRGLGPYGLQAAVAEQHALAKSVAATDWDRVVLLYEALARIAPSPVVDLNHAVAVAHTRGPGPALALVDALATDKALAGTHLLPAVRGELLTRLGRTDEARDALALAVERCPGARDRETLSRKLAALSKSGKPGKPSRPSRPSG